MAAPAADKWNGDFAGERNPVVAGGVRRFNEIKESMGRNGVAATASACIVLLILALMTSGQLQLASAESEIGRCYDDCLPDCEQGSSRAGCKLFCFTCCVLKPTHNCTRGGESTAAAPEFAGDAGCWELCTSSIGDATTGESRGNRC
uniref:Uncharacterized protein n=1 Tax=Oryza punctata TaxID=4537 RepID=A0A0E0JV86_ORYPU